MIHVYHKPAVSMMHQRLTASIAVGALARPKNMLCSRELGQDIGLRRKYLALWLDTYDEDILRAVAEMVVGRQLPSLPLCHDEIAQAETVLHPHKQRRDLAGFLETFFVEVRDLHASGSETDQGTQRWQQTVLRSLTLIWILDQVKMSCMVPGRLFKKRSPRKTSKSIVHAMVALLLPYIGDIGRTLKHLEYEVRHGQDPLDEVHYYIENIAVDLRSGILLTRLVEILLFENARKHIEEIRECVITRGEGQCTRGTPALSRIGQRQAKTLSRQLVMPCVSRAQKLHNVHIALSALEIYGELDSTPIAAQDVVDGHREKTLDLLWYILSVHALGHLVDWTPLIADIH
ncbi:hypothetical protein K431DRAFT_21331 [Polychaeton citri CBS 116435]|uniref:Calponin-homology (CH) domain-containing protein n=1 Tax=Polychaeton citri CBS 116435 TaxID=1314669 RepID=A0A9P4QA23_9PEZI|nr:hypothetical protein K431DRAFT_21331 [Polychaeton citri CBS 116435]